MKASLLRVAVPGVVLLVLLGLWDFWPELAAPVGLDPAPSARWEALLCWLAAAWLTTRLLHVLLWEGTVTRRTGVPPPQLLTVLSDAVIWLAAAAAILALPFHQPVGAFLTTSGVAFAVAGFAGRGLLSDAVSGIATTFDRSFGLGDFVSVGGLTGKVVHISWRATTLLPPNGVLVIVPNSRMAESTLLTYRVYREEIDVDLHYEVPPDLVDRMLLAAAREVVPPMAGHNPMVWLIDFTPNGVRWRLLYWYHDYNSSFRLRSDVHRAILRNLHFAGHQPAAVHQWIEFGRPVTEAADGDSGAAAFIGKVPIFRTLTRPERDQLATACVTRSVAAGTLVVREGDPGDSLFLIREGMFDVVIGASDTPVARLGAGNLFGEMSLLTGSPRAASVRAVEDGVVIEITHEALLPIIGQREQLAEQLSAVLAERQQSNAALAARANAAPAPVDTKNDLLNRIRAFFGLAVRS